MFSAFEYFKFFRCTRISSTQYYSEQYASSKHWAFIETRLDMNICEFSHLNFKSSPISSWFRCLCFLGACSVWYNGQFDWITYCVKLEHWLHNYHKHHNRQWHVFLKPGTFFPQRMKKERNVYTEHVNTNLHFLCVMEIPDTHTKYQMYKKAKDTNHDKKTPCMAMKTICTPSKTTKIPSIPTKIPSMLTKIKVRQPKHQCEFVIQHINLRCFVAKQFLSQIYALFGILFTGLKWGMFLS